ncbi:L,D-transpeptidase family protein [Rhodoblastus sp.]|uniref:L,D-transpeptidase family protein n=1 Tax=Rhodoblastus sp. TaxID=1962975 RepID=UPI003F98AD33
MKHRKLRRFLTLSGSCAVSLCLGAYLSYQAGVQQQSALSQSAEADQVAAPGKLAASEQVAGAEQVAASEQVATAAPVAESSAQNPGPANENPTADRAVETGPPAEAQPSVQTTAAPQAELASSVWLRVSLPATREPLASSSASAPLGLRGDEAARDAAPANNAPSPAQPEVLASLEIMPPDADFSQDRPVPLPPRRPASLSAAVATADAPAPQLNASPAAALPAPTQPVTPAPAAASAPPPPVAVAPQPVAPTRAAVAAQPSPAPAASGEFSGIAGALAAVTASVGGNTPLPPGGENAAASPALGDGFKKGAPVYVRIFKQEGTMELWIKRGESYALYKSFPICKWSGQLGPKTRQSDLQSPEGFYSVSARQLNPHSAYHLAFDVGYPNAFDRRQGSTGSAVMVHGDCKSIGCFAMTNNGIDEIYSIVAAALAGGQREVPVHIFPFRMTESAIARESAPAASNVLAFLSTDSSPPSPRRDWSPFWRNLKQGYDLFERSHVPPVAYACGDRYVFGAAGQSCARIAGW